MKLLKRYCVLAESAARELEQDRLLFLSCLCIFLFAATAAQARSKPLWYDELFTYYMSHLPDMGAIWNALKQGADQNPPFLYIATRASYAIFGDSALATRLPEMLGFLVMSVCLFKFVSKRCTAVFGFIPMLLPWITGAQRYASEARSYGLVLGFCGLAIVFWQMAHERNPRAVALAGLTLSLAGALMSHCYAVLLFIPFIAGEAAHWYYKRRIDWPVCASIAITMPLVLTYLPLLRAYNTFALNNPIFRPQASSIPAFWIFLLGPALFPIVAGLCVMLLPFEREQRSDISRPGIPAHEVALAVGLILIPAAAVALAATVTHVYMDRYGLAAVIGSGVLFAFLGFTRSGDRNVAGVTVLVIFVLAFIAPLLETSLDASTQSVTSQNRTPDQIEKDLPLVIGSGLLFLPIDHGATTDLASRLYFLRDPQAALRYTGSSVFDNGYLIVKRWFPIRGHIEDYDKFISEHQRFMVYGPMHFPLDWLIFRLIDDGARMNLRGQFGENLLFEVRQIRIRHRNSTYAASLNGRKTVVTEVTVYLGLI